MFEHGRLAVDPGLVNKIVELYKDPVNARGHSYGLWHSSRLRTNPYPWFNTTFNSVADKVAGNGLTIDEWWFNCGAPGDEYRWHTHNPYPWAGVFYIQTPENSGGLEFKKLEKFFTFRPSVGDFLLFPGTLKHRILKNHSGDFRISVGFNFVK